MGPKYVNTWLVSKIAPAGPPFVRAFFNGIYMSAKVARPYGFYLTDWDQASLEEMQDDEDWGAAKHHKNPEYAWDHSEEDHKVKRRRFNRFKQYEK